MEGSLWTLYTCIRTVESNRLKPLNLHLKLTELNISNMGEVEREELFRMNLTVSQRYLMGSEGF